MALMVSPAGDMEVQITKLGTEKGKLFMSGQIGVWDSQIYFERSEVVRMVKLVLSPPVVKYILALPCAMLGEKLGRKKQG